jgi:hypothetical protein
LNDLTKIFFDYVENNSDSLNYCINFEKYINNVEEIDMIS